VFYRIDAGAVAERLEGILATTRMLESAMGSDIGKGLETRGSASRSKSAETVPGSMERRALISIDLSGSVCDISGLGAPGRSAPCPNPRRAAS
jgi:hypothetical protein